MKHERRFMRRERIVENRVAVVAYQQIAMRGGGRIIRPLQTTPADGGEGYLKCDRLVAGRVGGDGVVLLARYSNRAKDCNSNAK